MTAVGRHALERWSSADLAGVRPVVAVPVGSCEQHGPHLPLGTDTLVAVELARRLCAAAAAERRHPVVVGPALTVTSSGEHAGFPGTLSIGAAATAALVVELVRSADWALGVVLVNGHGGNAGPVASAVAQLRREGRSVVAWWPQVEDGDAHAGRTETSLVLAIEATLVDTGRLRPGDLRPLPVVADQLRREGVRAVSPSGVLGDPTGATLGEGVELLERLTADLVASVEDARRSWSTTT